MLSKEEIENLSALFLSKDDDNTKLAFEMMKPYGFISELATEIFVVFKLTKSADLRAQATNLLNQYASANIKKAMERKLEFNTEKTIKVNIEKYVSTSNRELDGLKFAQALYNKYDLGFAYLMKEGSSKEIRQILNNHVNGTSFKLNRKGLTTMPNEFFELTELEDIDLSGNKLSSISNKFKVFKNLRKLNVSYNCLKKIHPSLASLQHLEDLNLDKNLVEEFPEVLGDIKSLRRLSMNDMLNISGLVRGVKIPDNFFSLKLNYLSISSDSLNGNSHGYEGLPYISKIEKLNGEYIDLTPLGLAKQAFEAGQIAPVYYLLYYAESTYRQKVLAKFYDSETKTMNLSDMYIKFLPEELSLFDIRVLNMKESKFGYNFHLVKSSEEGLQAIGKLSNLEELYLDQNALYQIPDIVFNCTKLRILSMHDNRITTVQPAIKKLAQLTSLDLDSSSWDPIIFPDEIMELTHLKEVRINFLAHKSDEIKQNYIQRLDYLFGNRVALNKYI